MHLKAQSPSLVHKDKVSKAFTVYDEYLTDYQKTYGAIQAYLQQDGQYKVTYNQEFIDIT